MKQSEIAERIAREAHKGQFRRDGKTPYITHPARVVMRMESDEEKAVAWMHDVLEDTGRTKQSLWIQGVSNVVITAVMQLTRNIEESYNEYLERVKSNDLARKVKLQDMLDNLSDSPTKYQIKKYGLGLYTLVD